MKYRLRSFFSSIGQEGLEDNQQKKQSFPLLGKGVLIGIVDSGIDYENPDFRNTDGTTRILAYGIRRYKCKPPGRISYRNRVHQK